MNTDHQSRSAPTWALSGTPKAKLIPKLNKDNVKGEEVKKEDGEERVQREAVKHSFANVSFHWNRR